MDMNQMGKNTLVTSHSVRSDGEGARGFALACTLRASPIISILSIIGAVQCLVRRKMLFIKPDQIPKVSRRPA